ncbi:hypothetical protein STOPSMEL_3 [Sinorhizobium phage StopSmel]|nr:hypothetical protein STOPSMEL_3 [Sinorhizobium phage StopSmel]
MIVKPRLDQSKLQTHGITPGFARIFERFGYVVEPIDTPRGGVKDGRPEQRP